MPEDSVSIANLQNELDFNKWYNEVEEDLLEASYDQYQYESPLFPPPVVSMSISLISFVIDLASMSFKYPSPIWIHYCPIPRPLSTS